MAWNDAVWVALLVCGALQLLVLVLLWRKPDTSTATADTLLQALDANRRDMARELRQDVQEASRAARQEASANMATFQQTLVQHSAEAARTQNARLDAFGTQLAAMQKGLADTLSSQLGSLSEANARRLQEMRGTLETQLAQLQSNNATKLEEMRVTVDEKLQSTLQARLGESFKQVADRLEQVHKGLGEMQTLAQGVGDLKHLLTNVKTRGIFGEAQLAALLEQVFVPDQYAAQVATRPGSKNLVDFAIKLPGKAADGAPLWLPIDAKFPNEDYARLLDAQGRADPVDADAAAKALEQRIRLEAKSITEKIRGAAVHHRLRDFVFAHRGLVRRGLAPPRLDGGFAARLPGDAGRSHHAAGHAELLANGLSYPGVGEALQRSLAGTGRGQNRVRQVW